MKVYSLTQVGCVADVGCYGVFYTVAKATEFAIDFAEGNCEKYTGETTWDGFTKKVYCGDYEFEIWRHNLDDME